MNLHCNIQVDYDVNNFDCTITQFCMYFQISVGNIGPIFKIRLAHDNAGKDGKPQRWLFERVSRVLEYKGIS